MESPSFRDRATLLLSGLEEGKEVRTYLAQFSKSDGGCFAVIKVGGAIVAEDTEPLAERLALLQALGLKPIVVFGAGPQLDERLSAMGIEPERIDNLRVTDEKAIATVAEESAATGLALSEAISRAGGHASLAPPSVTHAEAIDENVYGRVGRAESVREDALKQILAANSIPLVSCIGSDKVGRLLNVNADDIARQIALVFQPQKIVFLTGTGALLDGENNPIDAINLESDYEKLRAAPWIHSGMALKLDMINQLLSGLPLSSSVSITSTAAMMKELFTHGGAGTLIRKGEAVVETESVDAEKLTPLIEEAFGRKLDPKYWQNADIKYVIHTERFRAAAVVTSIDGVDILDKFAVSYDARGEGLAKAVWRQLVDRSPRLIWRSRQSNPFNAFYLSVADGFVKRGEWIVLWCGIEADDGLMTSVRMLAEKEHDFEVGDDK